MRPSLDNYRLNCITAAALKRGKVMLDITVAVCKVVISLNTTVFEPAATVITQVTDLFLKF